LGRGGDSAGDAAHTAGLRRGRLLPGRLLPGRLLSGRLLSAEMNGKQEEPEKGPGNQ
jgi:hypothetical protein